MFYTHTHTHKIEEEEDKLLILGSDFIFFSLYRYMVTLYDPLLFFFLEGIEIEVFLKRGRTSHVRFTKHFPAAVSTVCFSIGTKMGLIV